ncbi:MAG: YggS family pyridoxal phosphate-dependent enzyme [Spirochaetaceae bacterium]|nr:YggS family pyridoxal phosphate-dependent enzyme [Spirochaetaceae bacterium]
MGDYDFVSDNAKELRGRVEAAAARAGRDAAGVELMAVTKFHPVEAALAAYEAGFRLFGESRVQEAEGKFPAFLAARPDARLEMIGNLQSNKAKKAAQLFSRVQSVDSPEILRELGKRARQAGRRLEILFELHTGEESKAGFPDADSLYRAAELAAELERAAAAAGEGAGLELRGLMTMAPYTRDEAPIRASFRSLRAAMEGLASRFSFKRLDVLSMGMTNDFEIAVEEGSTLLRVGTALFGSRAP